MNLAGLLSPMDYRKYRHIFFNTAFLLTLLFLPLKSVFAQKVWEKDPYKIFLKDGRIQLFHQQKEIVQINAFEFNFIIPEKIQVEKTYNDALILKLIFSEDDGYHKDFPSQILLKIEQSNNTFHFSASHKAFNHVTIQLKDNDEHYFGLIEKLYPNNSKNPDLKGNVIDVDVYGYGNLDYAENYSSAYSAFYMSSNGYGSFFNTFAKGRYKLGLNGTTEIYHQTGKLDWYVFYGPGGDKIHKEYFDVIGKPKYIPIWACGPIFWRDQNNGGKDELLDDIRKFTDLQIPFTACFIDRPYSDGSHRWSKMNFNDKFSHPEVWIKKINDEYGLQLMTWVGPATFDDTDFPGLLPNYVHYIDLTNPQALKEFEKRLATNLYSVGVKGHKMDRAEEHFPMTARWNDPVSESESRNKYIYLYAKVINDFLTKAHGKDNFNFSRTAFHRTQPYLSALWGGDSRSNWQGMSGNMANAIRCGFMGFPVWGNDTGGYLGEGRIDSHLYMRWLQWSAWNGMFEIKIDGSGGRGEDRPPWKYSKQLQTIFKNACDFRMDMLPYIYSCVNTSYKNGVAMKPLAYMYPDDKNTYNIWDEFIFGKAFLVAPLFSNKDERQVYLPKGKWYDFYAPAKEYSGPATLDQSIPVERIPVFIKTNSIYVTGNIYNGNSKIWDGKISGKEFIRIHLFPGETGEESDFTYVDFLDNDKEKMIKLTNNGKAITFTANKINCPATAIIRSAAKPGKILLNGKEIKFSYDESNKMIEIVLNKDVENTLEILN